VRALNMGGAHSCGPFEGELSPSLSSRYFKSTATGLLVHHRSWTPAAPPRATVILVHGLGEHIGRYSVFASALTASGFAVHALDLAGHGASHGDRGYVASLDGCVADVLELAARVAPAPRGAPCMLLGHSFGGLVALRAAQTAEGAARFAAGAVLSAPAIAGDPSLATPLNKWLARALSGAAPKLRIAAIDAAKLCSDASVVAAYKRDPLVYAGAMAVRTGAEMLAGADAALAAAAAAGAPCPPLLVVQATADAVCLAAGARALAAARAAAGGACTLVEYGDGALHELLNEPGIGERATADIVSWINARVEAVAK